MSSGRVDMNDILFRFPPISRHSQLDSDSFLVVSIMLFWHLMLFTQGEANQFYWLQAQARGVTVHGVAFKTLKIVALLVPVFSKVWINKTTSITEIWWVVMNHSCQSVMVTQCISHLNHPFKWPCAGPDQLQLFELSLNWSTMWRSQEQRKRLGVSSAA